MKHQKIVQALDRILYLIEHQKTVQALDRIFYLTESKGFLIKDIEHSCRQ